MKALSNFKSKVKKIAVRSLAVLALAAAFVVPTAVTNSYATGETATPRFNFLQGDTEMLTAANYTKGQTAWVDPVSGEYKADTGNEIVFRFYFHNGQTNSTAHNVTLKAAVSDQMATTHKVYSTLSSTETAAITDTVVNGQIVGYGNGFAQVDLNAPGRLEYIAGSTKMWRTHPNQWGTALPDGITSSTGLNIGSVEGCWDFAGYVTFKMRVRGEARIVIEKYVAYPGAASWQSVLDNAKEGEVVAWRIGVRNLGDSDAANVLVKDTLPAKLTYMPGSTVYFGPDAPANGYIMPDGITGNGLFINTLRSGVGTFDNNAYFTFKTRIGSNLSYNAEGKAELVNRATATYQNQSVSADAKVIVCGVTSLIINKTVWNGSAWVEQNNIQFGQNIRYRITVKNNGQTDMTNLIVSDVIPVYTRYIIGSTTFNGAAQPDGITGNGISLGAVARGATATIEFEVKTYGCPPIGDYTLVNVAYATTDQTTVVSDTATTIMTLRAASGPIINGL